MIRTPEGAAPDFKNKDYNLTADVNLPTGAENGVLATIGGRYSGWSWYLKDGCVHLFCMLISFESVGRPAMPPPFNRHGPSSYS